MSLWRNVRRRLLPDTPPRPVEDGEDQQPPLIYISSDEESLPETERNSPVSSWQTLMNLSRTPPAVGTDEDSTSLPSWDMIRGLASPAAERFTRPPDAPPSYEDSQRMHYESTYPKELVFQDASGKRVVYRRVDDVSHFCAPN